MGQAKPSQPMLKTASIAHLERMRQNEERKRKKREREEIEAAMQVQALARDPARAGIDMQAVGRRGDISIKRDKRDGSIVRAEREGRNVFCQLGRLRAGQEAPTLDNDMVDAGNRVIELYAKKMGLAGSGAKPEERVDETPIRVGFLDDKMNRALKRWATIMREFGRFSRTPTLFELLCQDAMETEATLGADIRAGGKSRWRFIVEQVTGEREPHAQASVIRSACTELVIILNAIEGGVRRI